MSSICFNGNIFDSDQPIFPARNRGFRYGDGLFETMKVLKGEIVLEQYHYDRLLFGLKLLNIGTGVFPRKQVTQSIKNLCKQNDCVEDARVRLAVFRSDTNRPAWVIEAMPLQQEAKHLNQRGWQIDLYPHARKSCDALANLKSANYLPYIMAGLYAEENNLDECLVLNSDNNISDASKANIFLMVNGDFLTPALHQGCVSGVKRRFIIDELKNRGHVVHQKEIKENDLLAATEVFLTNAINDIRWVEFYRLTQYRNDFVKRFYAEVFATF